VPGDFQHPGGKQLLRAFDGKDISHLFPGGPLQPRGGASDGDGVLHRHTVVAKTILERFRTGKRTTDAESTPVVFEVGKLEEKYHDWVNTPENDVKPRFFRSEVCEQLSKTSWWVIPLVWVPISAACFVRGRISSKLSVHQCWLCFLFGALFWTFAEYFVHRFLFHVRTSSYWPNTLHFLFHGCHHKFPMDDMRLVMPPVAAAPIALALVTAESLLLGSRALGLVAFAGTIVAYIFYDLFHYFCHFSDLGGLKILCVLKANHMQHHYVDHTSGYGISSPLWDFVFRTKRHQVSD